MRKLYSLLLLVMTSMSLPSCLTPRLETSLISTDSLRYTPEELDRLAKFNVFLTPINDHQALLTQPAKRQGKQKWKNVGNTDNSQHKSNNTDSRQKDIGNITAKDEAIIGNDNAPVEAKKHAIVGDGNTTEEEASLWWLWLLLGVAITATGLIWWYRKYG
ncbi:hypothetical protein [Pontibacter sp. H249]|uniref:hypothetical protein n=1 Tax=Pontibacter sp. H249 TaxID=3133420 RepID=UPI0030C12C4E